MSTVIARSACDEAIQTRHSGATRSGEPGIHNHDWELWIPGPRQEACPGMTGMDCFVHRAALCADPLARNDDHAYFFAYETPMPARTSLWMP
jgi:hypothetical protein